MRKNTAARKIALLITFIGLVVFVAAASDAGLTVGRFDIETDKIREDIRLTLVTDLHSCDYGSGQTELTDAIETENPDAVLLVGDIFDDALPRDNAVEFTKAISEKYPCFYVSGNHEFRGGQADDFKSLLESFGVKVLEGTSEIFEIGYDKIRISGIDDPETDDFASRAVTYAEQLRRLNEKPADSGLFSVLLSHRPERIEEFLPFKPDLVLSGHAHGGQWRLPLLLENGLVAPNQGFFPKYTNGKYEFEDTTAIVSRGLARESTKFVPRIFNRPEIVVIDIRNSSRLQTPSE